MKLKMDALQQVATQKQAEQTGEAGEPEFKEPPLLGLLTRLFRGIKYDIRNIHIRYEDDFYTPIQRPISFGLTIRHIKLDTDLEQEEREQAENSSTIVKL